MTGKYGVVRMRMNESEMPNNLLAIIYCWPRPIIIIAIANFAIIIRT